jgi:hypothetical protein
MIKFDEVHRRGSCLDMAFMDERLFVLLARDAAAPAAIRAWIAERIRLGLNKEGDTQIIEARDCAEKMEAERIGIRARIDREKQIN